MRKRFQVATYTDVSQSTSQDYSYYQDQGWYTDQNYSEQSQQYNEYYNNNNYQQQQQQNYRHNYKHRPKYQQQQQSNNYSGYQYQQQSNNYSGYQYQQQSNSYSGYQQQQQQNWQRKKRPHEKVDQQYSAASSCASQTSSPEPKRQLQRQNSFQSVAPSQSNNSKTFQKPNTSISTAAAYQTQTVSNQAWKIAKMNISNTQSQNSNNVFAIQEEKSLEWNALFAKTLNLLKGCRAGEEVNIILTNLQSSRSSMITTKDEIRNSLMKLMAPLQIEKIFIFGSTLTGLDFNGSDLDFYIQLKVMPSNDEENRIIIKKAAKLTRSNQRNEFQIICTIPNARVPIIRLLHKATTITCDVNFISNFGYYNSCFINFVLGYEKRIKDLAVILKLWSKSYKLAQQMIISNYCLVMLLIFYLQNLETPMLDTIYNNQLLRSPMILDQKRKWNVFFNDNINLTRNNVSSLRELLVGFFEFYDKLNYDEYVVSLYTGELIKRIYFDKAPKLQESRNIVQLNNLTPLKADIPGTLIVQDGFELNLNVGIKVKKHTDLFFELIKLSHQKCIELKDEPFSEVLIKLYTDVKVKNPVKEANENKGKNKKKFQLVIHAIAGDLKACQDILTSQDKDKVYSAEDQQKFFFDHVTHYTETFLKDVYLCTVIPDLSEHTQSTSSTMQTKFKVILQYDTVNGRKKMSFKDDESLENEKSLSAKMLAKKVPLDLEILMTVSTKDKGKTIDIDMFDFNGAKKKTALLTFGNFFSINITTALKFYLRKRWEVVMKNS